MVNIILTDEVINKIIKSNTKCTYINADYVILYKNMEAPDDKLDEYFERIRLANESGINTPKVIEYRLLSESIGKVSKGIFVEERAKGNVLNIRGKVLKQDGKYDFETVINEYLENVSKYLDELEKRANASQEMYDKFLNDFIEIHSFGLKPDPNSLNYLFDENNGFSIIDPYMNDLKEFTDRDLFKHIINDIYGASRPTIIIKKDKPEGFYYLPEIYKSRLDKYSAIINKKIFHAFKQKGYSDEKLLTELEKNKMRFYTEKDSLEKADLIETLKEQFFNNKKTY